MLYSMPPLSLSLSLSLALSCRHFFEELLGLLGLLAITAPAFSALFSPELPLDLERRLISKRAYSTVLNMRWL